MFFEVAQIVQMCTGCTPRITPLKISKNIPAEALPACENDQNYYVLTARSQFLHSKPIKKKGPSTLGMTTLPSLQPQKGQPQLFLTLKIIERSIKFMWKCQ